MVSTRPAVNVACPIGAMSRAARSVACRQGVADGEFLEAVILEPGRRPFAQAQGQLRFGLTQFSLRELAEEVMAAIPASYRSRLTSRFEEASDSRSCCEPRASVTASPRGPHKRSRTDVRLRNSTVAGFNDDRTS